MKISATGCSVVDNLYSPVKFNSVAYKHWCYENGIENGLITGGLVFGEDIENSSGVPYANIIDEITMGEIIPEKNIGGPAIVALIHLVQVFHNSKHKFNYFGCRSDDANGEYIASVLDGFDIDTKGYYIAKGGVTPFTDVLSDPEYNDKNGERTFINFIGVANDLTGYDLPSNFYDSDIVIFGGTALTPRLHDDLSYSLKRAKDRGAITCVSTIYDFRNQKNNHGKPWPLVSAKEDYRMIDLLIMDNEEALKISATANKENAIKWFAKNGANAVIITHGAEDIICFSNGLFFLENEIFSMPVSAAASNNMRQLNMGEADTTGCGDNFAGGLYASLIKQMEGKYISLKKAVAFAAVSGGFAGSHKGGVFFEKETGEKLEKLNKLLGLYNKQISSDL